MVQTQRIFLAMLHCVTASTDEQQQQTSTGPHDEEPPPELLDLAIVGAGISGLMAARTVREKRAGIHFRVFEKSAHPGGLLGGLKARWITRHHFHAMSLCRELNIPLTTVWRQSEASETRRSLISVGPFGELTPNPNERSFFAPVRELLVQLESTRFMRELDCLCTVKLIPRNAENMDDFLRRKLLFEASRRFFRFLIKIGTGFYPAELTVSDCLRVFRSMSSVRDLYGMLTLQNGHLQPIGSPNWELLVEQLVARIGTETVNYSTNIVQVEITSEQRREIVSLTDSTGRRWRARYVILAVSCLDLLHIRFEPTQPLYFQQPNSQLGLWSMANFTVRYPAPYWRDHGYTGCIFCPTQSLICYESGHNQLSGTYFSPLRGVVDDTERLLIRDTVLRLLRANFSCRTMQKPLECTVEVQPIPFYFDVFPTFERCIIFASTNVSCWYRGFINGSVQGGIRAAILALLEIRPQTITFREVTEMQCIHFKYFQPRAGYERFWYSLNLASVGRFVAGTGALLLTLGVCRLLLKTEFWGCVAVLSVTWILCLTCFGMLVLPKGYYFNKTGLLACEPFYSKSSYRILSSCALYFPTTMVLMYCYGSSFHANRYRLATPSAASLSLNVSNSCGNGSTGHGPNAAGAPDGNGGYGGGGGGGGGGRREGDHIETLAGTTLTANGSGLEHHSCDGNTLTGITAITPMSVSFSEKSQFAVEDDRQIHGSTSRTMAAISLGFIVIITPWTILEIVATCTGSKIPPSIDFCVTWIALSSSFWNPFLYWLLNARFRKICKELLTSKCTGSQSSLEEKCSISLEYDHHITSLPLPPGPPPATICRSANHTPRPDVECSEKYWGDILERTFSTGSINTLHRIGTTSLSYVNRAPVGHATLQFRCEAHQHLVRNASSTSIGKERHATAGLHYKDDAKDGPPDFTALYAPGSDPQVCDHELHDINCAKNKAFFRGFNLHQGLPDI